MNNQKPSYLVKDIISNYLEELGDKIQNSETKPDINSDYFD
jgi:hypothetical protein